MSNLQSLSELYQNKLFRIPDYQRGYAWKKDQLIDFWDDIMNLQGGIINGLAHESTNFKNYGGKYYGFVQTPGNINLEKYFKNASKQSDYIDDVLVVWCATSETNFVIGRATKVGVGKGFGQSNVWYASADVAKYWFD